MTLTKMRILFFVIIFIKLATVTFSQDISKNLYDMTPEQNIAWLATLKKADKEQQLTLIQNRFFRQSTFKKSENENIPVLVVNGIPISEEMNLKSKDFLAYHLTADKVEVEVLDKEPEGLYVNKRWTCIIILNVTDKKSRKKLNKVK